jgi:hypothetical protein
MVGREEISERATERERESARARTHTHGTEHGELVSTLPFITDGKQAKNEAEKK